jgi:hypothetical protein
VLRDVTDRHGLGLGGVLMQTSDEVLRQLRLAEFLPPELARATLAA